VPATNITAFGIGPSRSNHVALSFFQVSAMILHRIHKPCRIAFAVFALNSALRLPGPLRARQERDLAPGGGWGSLSAEMRLCERCRAAASRFARRRRPGLPLVRSDPARGARDSSRTAAFRLHTLVLAKGVLGDHRDVCCWGISGSRFWAAGLPILARLGHSSAFSSAWISLVVVVSLRAERECAWNAV